MIISKNIREQTLFLSLGEQAVTLNDAYTLDLRLDTSPVGIQDVFCKY
jgi:hypothetical protein